MTDPNIEKIGSFPIPAKLEAKFDWDKPLVAAARNSNGMIVITVFGSPKEKNPA